MQESYMVKNAGLILLAPFLPQLMKRLDLAGEDGQLRGERAQAMAIRAMARLTDMEDPLAEADLVLNKVLCGWHVQKTVTALEPAGFMEDVDFRYERLNFLQAVLRNWPGAGGMNAEGLIQDFLIRRGRLDLDAWRLSIEAAPQDALLQSVPWTTGLIQLPWMGRPVQVVWETF